ncbi:MAG: hypothetical protein WAN21_02380 [Candidatus Sulfotelmatobacter sp.]|jgi:hypothetical protein
MANEEDYDEPERVIPVATPLSEMYPVDLRDKFAQYEDLLTIIAGLEEKRGECKRLMKNKKQQLRRLIAKRDKLLRKRNKRPSKK